jgi:hypothetical protein
VKRRWWAGDTRPDQTTGHRGQPRLGVDDSDITASADVAEIEGRVAALVASISLKNHGQLMLSSDARADGVMFSATTVRVRTRTSTLHGQVRRPEGLSVQSQSTSALLRRYEYKVTVLPVGTALIKCGAPSLQLSAVAGGSDADCMQHSLGGVYSAGHALSHSCIGRPGPFS